MRPFLITGLVNDVYTFTVRFTVMVYTLGTAAKATGKSKTAIASAIKSGKIKAIKTDSGYEIAPDDLSKVYPLVYSKGLHLDSKPVQVDCKLDSTPVNHALEIENAVLRARLEDVIAERDRLVATNERLISSMDLRERSIRLLSHQSEQTTETSTAKESAENQDKKVIFMWLLFAVAVVEFGFYVVMPFFGFGV